MLTSPWFSVKFESVPCNMRAESKSVLAQDAELKGTTHFSKAKAIPDSCRQSLAWTQGEAELKYHYNLNHRILEMSFLPIV